MHDPWNEDYRRGYEVRYSQPAAIAQLHLNKPTTCALRNP